MPLASSRGSIESAAETVDSTKRVSRMSLAVKRRQSLRSKSRNKSVLPPKEKENQEKKRKSKKFEDVRSPGPTPYWMVAKERDGQRHSPRLTRSTTKKRRSDRPPLINFTKDDVENNTDDHSVGVVLSFSPPDQNANKLREAEDLSRKENARDTRVQFARDNKQLLVFSPNSGRPLQDFDEDEYENISDIGMKDGKDNHQNPETMEEYSPPPAKLLFGDKDELMKSLMKSLSKGKRMAKEEGKIADDTVTNVVSTLVDRGLSEEYKSLQEKLDLLLESKSIDENTRAQKEKLIALETQNESLDNEKMKLEKKVDDLENERKTMQNQIIDMKDQVLVSNVRVDSDVTAVRRDASSNLAEKNTKLPI